MTLAILAVKVVVGVVATVGVALGLLGGFIVFTQPGSYQDFTDYYRNDD